MTDAEFEALVARLDVQSRCSPAAYRLKVTGLAFAGYVYVALVLAVALVLFMASVASALYLHALAVKLAFVFGAFFWVVARAMWVRLEPPQGRRVTRKSAPELFDMIDRLRRSLQAPHFHDVLITDDFNASVMQTPRLGLLGFYRNTLLIGLPLMKALTREQLAAVLAHEFGHLAGGHGRLGHWVYRLRYGWTRLAQALQDRRSMGSFAFTPFFKWYAPYFNAFSFPLARANEYEADAASVRLTSPAAAAGALTSVNVIGSFLQARFWPDLHRKADEVAVPSFAPYAQMGEAIGAGVDEEAVRGWLSAAMARETSVADTHPSLADRLKAIDQAPVLVLPKAGEAADTLLGAKALQAITEEFDCRWRAAIQPAWDRRHQEVRAKREQLAALDARAARGTAMTDAERMQRAILTGEVGAGVEQALEQFHALHDEFPEDAAICYGLGSRLLATGQDAGVALIERAIERDENAQLPGAELLRDHFARRGQADAARQWHERALQRARLLHAAQVERSGIFTNDKFEPHGLNAAQVEALQAKLRAIPDVRRAYLLRKVVQHLPDRPLLVLAFTTKPLWRLHRPVRSAGVQEEIVRTVPFPGEGLITCVETQGSGLGRKWWAQKGARII
jgi:Zn-dependent protease with chaperone function